MDDTVRIPRHELISPTDQSLRTGEGFWSMIITRILLTKRKLLQHYGKMFPTPKFFPAARLNFAGSVLSQRNSTATALIEAHEGSLKTNNITWGKLYSSVERQADALKSLGVGEGDRVAAVMANTEHSISLCLATLSFGGIWSSISPDFGTKGILDRLLQIRPKVVFADSSTIYNGRLHDHLPVVRDWAKVLAKDNSLIKIIFTPSDMPVEVSSIPKAMDHGTFLSLGIGRPLEFLNCHSTNQVSSSIHLELQGLRNASFIVQAALCYKLGKTMNCILGYYRVISSFSIRRQRGSCGHSSSLLLGLAQPSSYILVLRCIQTSTSCRA